MSSSLYQLFSKLGYTEKNGLYIIKDISSYNSIPNRFARVLSEIIKPFAVFILDSNSESNKNATTIDPINTPMILFYSNPSNEDMKKIAKDVFNLNKVPVIFIERGNTLDIYNGYSFSSNNPFFLEKLSINESEFSIENLISGDVWKDYSDSFLKKRKTIDKHLLQDIIKYRGLLISKIGNKPALQAEIANKLIGRIIFIRYLIDRGVEFTNQALILGDTKQERIDSLNYLITRKEDLYQLFDFIFSNFKGDLFPFYKDSNSNLEEFDLVTHKDLEILSFLFKGGTPFHVNGDLFFQPTLFNFYDFEIIPVELISNIYETFLGTPQKTANDVTKLSKQKEIQAYYTPSYLVDYILSKTVKHKLLQSETSSCKVLDPSCGSGIFLVETLRQIIEKEIDLNQNDNLSNETLWKLLQDNIFGIDIDSNAIEITTFSLYITLLDYKKYPKEIERFQFKNLINNNLFPNCDFFNIEHEFNKILKNKHLDFIIGNPPWGQVKNSLSKEYIKRIHKEKRIKVGGNEISQAFMIRANDLGQSDTEYCFIVTNKNFYNKNSKDWRNYLLLNFDILEFFDLFGVQNKIAGGNQIFDNASQPAVICFYKQKSKFEKQNIIRYITAKANKFFLDFKTILIEKEDFKLIQQNFLIQNDWAWKTLLHGNIYDFYYIQKLKSTFTFPKSSKNSFLFEKEKFLYHGGYKFNDTAIKKRKELNSDYYNLQYLEVDARVKDLEPFYCNSSITFKDKIINDYNENKLQAVEPLHVAQLPDLMFFNSKIKLLIKKGLEYNKYEGNYFAVSSVNSKPVAFSSTVASIIPKENNLQSHNFLYALSAIINSDFFIYYVLMTSSSFGTDRNRVNFEEFINIPITLDEKLIDIAKKFTNSPQSIDKKLLNKVVYEAYNVSEHEKQLIDYALNVSIPIMRRFTEGNLYKKIKQQEPISILEDYCSIFFNHFDKRYEKNNLNFIAEIYITKRYIAINFRIVPDTSSVHKIQIKEIRTIDSILNKIGILGFNSISKQLYAQQDIRGFNKDSFYIIKPNNNRFWHKAIAFSDLNQFIFSLATDQLSKNKKQ